ncbi:hypothetical protein [Archangium sp.]|uniref:hypothetical protein n=1 Tax=Archangium sp. TaxID=1872627 RepID=UPI00286B0A62|nr:hypothetical protein [Archangium sp.]
MKTVGTVAAKYSEGSPEDEALRIVSVALLYVRDVQKLEDYRDYFREFVTGKPLIVSQAFATKEEADTWLSSGNAKDGEIVTIAGQGFAVRITSKGWKLLRMRLPDEPEAPEPK